MAQTILGISAYYHDSAAALLMDGEIVAAAHEERFSRIKHDSTFPFRAARYVLEEAGIRYNDLDAVAFYDKPYLKFERLLETYHAFAPRGLKSFLSAMPVWVKEKLFMRKMLTRELAGLGPGNPDLLFSEHHLSHAASAFYPSPFASAAILTIDGVGEWATTTICSGRDNRIEILREIDFPHSLGLLYSAFTYYCGFKVNSGEYKLMGLAPYGYPDDEETLTYKEKILDHLIDIREDGSFLLNMEFFDYATGLTMTCDKKWEKLFGIPRRKPESDLNQQTMNLACAIQQVTETVVLKLAETAKNLTGNDCLVMAGGVALNCVANGKLLRTNLFKDIWIQPAAGDAGGALGAALAATYTLKNPVRKINVKGDAMQGAYLGPEFDHKDIRRLARRYDAPYAYYENFSDLCTDVAEAISQGNVVGWFQGRMEYGPRALGNRSIIGDARNPEMQKKMNLKIKYREGFRPFAPSVLEEDADTYFELDRPSPYMLLVAPVVSGRCRSEADSQTRGSLFDRLYRLRSDIPAVTHIDYSARIQTVNSDVNPRYWALINAFKQLTGYSVIVNTSFNVRGEPIVCTPEDAYVCFMRTHMDVLVMGNFMFKKHDQKEWREDASWQNTYELD